MTNEERTISMEALKSKAEEALKAYNAAMLESKIKEALKAEKEAEDAVGEYTSLARAKCFEECIETGDAMLEAVKRLSYESICVKESKVEGSEDTVLKIEPKTRAIDLQKLHAYCDSGIGVDKQWPHIAQQLNFLLTAQKCIDLGVSAKGVNDSYAMSDIARSISMGKSPTSNTNMLKTLQLIVSAMVGSEHKATSHDVKFLQSVYSKKSKKALTVACAKHKVFIGYIAEICHRIVEGKTYDVEYQVKK